MKSSVKFLAAVTLFFAFSFAAQAQRGGQPLNPEQMAEKQTAQMVENLHLDQAQADRVKAINLNYATKLQEVRQENTGNREAMKELSTAIRSEQRAELQTVLTAEQFKTYEETQAQKASRGGDKGGNRGSRRS